jgi:hypothetical protein
MRPDMLWSSYGGNQTQSEGESKSKEVNAGMLTRKLQRVYFLFLDTKGLNDNVLVLFGKGYA